MPTDGGDGFSVAEHVDDVVAVIYQDLQFGVATFAAAEDDAFRPAQGQGFFGPHGDEIAFDFGYQAEGKAQDFAVDGIVKGVTVFGAVQGDLFFEAFSHDGHDVGQGAAQA